MFRFIYTLLLLVAVASASTLKYDRNYNLNPSTSLTTFACSDGDNGLITKYGVNTVGQLQAKLKPGVYIAATPFITGWNSNQCGLCYQARDPKTNKMISFVGLDVSRNAGTIIGGEDFFQQFGPLSKGNILIYLTAQGTSCFR